MTNFENSRVEIQVSRSKCEGYENSIFETSREIGRLKDGLTELEGQKEEVLLALSLIHIS